MRRVTIAAALITSGLLAGACGTARTLGAASAPRGVLTIANAGNSPWTCGFNPFNGSATALSLGPVYEPLAFVDTLRSGRATPWLATSWRWDPAGRSLTFSIRRGVTFTDGTPMTPADVVFSFDLIRKHPDLDIYGVWAVLSGVRLGRTGQVVMTFKRPAVPYFYYIADDVPVVPRHIWSKIARPAAYADAHPVGTGAFLLQSCTKKDIIYTANRRYWMPGEPRVATVKYPAFQANDPANTLLATGLAQWGSQFIPNMRAFYLSQSPDFHYWFPPTTAVSLLINLTEPLLARYGYSCNPARARRLLAAAGLRPGRDGVLADRAGRRLSFTVLDVAGYTDWIAAVGVIERNLKAVGIAVKAENVSPDSYSSRLSYGRFQLAYGAQAGGPTPYYELSQWLYSGSTAPVGKPAATNFERYRDPATDRLLAAYEATTTAAHPYAQPSVYISPDWGQVLLHLTPK